MDDAIKESREELQALFRRLVQQACLEHGVTESELWGADRKRTMIAVNARNWLADRLRSMVRYKGVRRSQRQYYFEGDADWPITEPLSYTEIGQLTGLDHSTIVNHSRRVRQITP